MNADEVLRFVGDNKAEFVDVRFCDLPGTVQHFTVPAESFGGKVFTDGLMFDGSSIRGFQQIHESDMLLLPDPATAVLDPFRQQDAEPHILRARPAGLPPRHGHRGHRVGPNMVTERARYGASASVRAPELTSSWCRLAS